jgi:hypothetical protein
MASHEPDPEGSLPRGHDRRLGAAYIGDHAIFEHGRSDRLAQQPRLVDRGCEDDQVGPLDGSFRTRSGRADGVAVESGAQRRPVGIEPNDLRGGAGPPEPKADGTSDQTGPQQGDAFDQHPTSP